MKDSGLRSEVVGAVGSVSADQLNQRVAAGVDAPAERGRRTAATRALLSIGHNSSPSTLKVWLEGARADIPGIPDRNPNRISRDLKAAPSKGDKRGNVTKFSDKSRRRLQRDIAKVKVAEITFTSVLTMPSGGEENYLDHDFAKSCFKLFLGRLASQRRFKAVSGYWKRELQKRGALHYHLLLYGLSCPKLRAEFHDWLVKTWNELVCAGLDPDEKEKHRWWHARAENFQEVSNMSGYFSKYVGKGVDRDGALGGRWWGSFNKAKLPFADEFRADLPIKAAVLMHRAARKLRSKKANKAKWITDSKALRESGFVITEMDMFRLRSGYLRDGFRNPTKAAEILALYKACHSDFGVTLGKARMRGKIPIQSPIVLCNVAAPQTVRRLIDYVEKETGEQVQLALFEKPSRENFMPDPLKAVPPGRTPVNCERLLNQADFPFFSNRLSIPPKRLLQMEKD